MTERRPRHEEHSRNLRGGKGVECQLEKSWRILTAIAGGERDDPASSELSNAATVANTMPSPCHAPPMGTRGVRPTASKAADIRA